MHNLLVLLGLCVVPMLLALPITSKPYGRSPDHLAWDTFGDSYGDDSLEPSADGYGKPKKIHPKSIFIAPTLNSVSTCGPGFTTDHRGNCIQTFQINHNALLLTQLNQLLAHHNQQSPNSPKQEDMYDYDYDYEVTSPSTKDAQKGPFQLSIPVQLDDDPKSQTPGPISGSTTTTTTSTTTSTTEKTFSTLTSFFEGLLPLKKDPFGLAATFTTTTTKTTTVPPMEENSTSKSTVETKSTTNYFSTAAQEAVDDADEEEDHITTNTESSATGSLQPDYTGTNQEAWTTSEFATELANEQLVPVTSTSTSSWDTATTSDAELLLSNADGTTTYDDNDEVEVTTETRDDITSSRGVVTSEHQQQWSQQQQQQQHPETTTWRSTTSEVTETVLPVQVTALPVKKLLPTLSSLFSTPYRTTFDWRSKPIAIVTPVPNPFPFQRTTFGGSLFKFTGAPVSTTTLPPRTTTTSATMTTDATVSDLLLGVENESENSQKLRESLIESEQKEINYEKIDVNNRFIYHHLNGPPPRDGSGSTTMLPIVVQREQEERLSGVDDDEVTAVAQTATPFGTTDKAPSIATSTPSFAQKLAALLRPKESERRRVSSASLWPSSSFATTTTPASTTTEATTPSFGGFSTVTSRYEDFLRSSSNRIRFPGPSVNRQPAPNKLIPSGQVATRSGNGTEKKPFWWFPNGWEVDTKQKEKPVLLRFWSKMPLIPDNVASQRRSSNYSRSNRENSKSPSESLYREVAIQDISKAFQDRQLDAAGS